MQRNMVLIPFFFLLLISVNFKGFCGAEARQISRHEDASSWDDSDTSNGMQQCMTGNDMDDCWRCSDSPWSQNRKKLASCALGYGRKAKGGKKGEIYEVTDSADDPLNPQPGTLRYGVIQEYPLWITFASDMVIDLQAELIVSSRKTIDGRGADVHVTGYGCITIQYVSHVIIHGIHVHNCKPASSGDVVVRPGILSYRDGSDGDGISVFGAKNVWVDHCTLRNCADGLIDVIVNSTHITISNNHFSNHDKVMLLGHSDDDTSEEVLRVTVAYNYFGENLGQRMPRCRRGRFHIVNNYYNHWQHYAVGGTANPSILSQGNVYIAPDEQSKKEVTSRINDGELDWTNWDWLSQGDELVNGAFFVQSGVNDIQHYKPLFSMQPKDSYMVTQITADAGVLKCDADSSFCIHN